MSQYPSLEQTAVKVLSEYDGDLGKAIKPFMRVLRSQASLFEELALDYLSELAERLGGHDDDETQRISAAKPVGHWKREAPSGYADGNDERAGHVGAETQTMDARSLVDVRKHKRQPQRTTQEIEAARIAAATSIHAVYDIRVGTRALGDVAWGELRTLKKQQVREATANLMLGIDQARLAIVLELLDDSCVVSDTTKKVRDIVGAKKLAGFVEMAKRMAPARVELGIQRANEAMEQVERLEVNP
jgi:hypothetical protein